MRVYFIVVSDSYLKTIKATVLGPDVHIFGYLFIKFNQPIGYNLKRADFRHVQEADRTQHQ